MVKNLPAIEVWQEPYFRRPGFDPRVRKIPEEGNLPAIEVWQEPYFRPV